MVMMTKTPMVKTTKSTKTGTTMTKKMFLVCLVIKKKIFFGIVAIICELRNGITLSTFSLSVVGGCDRRED